jgi:hypothetical protein
MNRQKKEEMKQLFNQLANWNEKRKRHIKEEMKEWLSRFMFISLPRATCAQVGA